MYFFTGVFATGFLLFQSHVPAGCREDGMHIYFLRLSHDLRFHDIFLFSSLISCLWSCNDKIVKAGVDGLFIICMGAMRIIFGD